MSFFNQDGGINIKIKTYLYLVLASHSDFSHDQEIKHIETGLLHGKSPVAV